MLKFKPELTTLEACHRLALNEGQKENKKGDEKVASKSKNVEEDKLGDELRTLGTILKLVGIPILIIVAVLFNMPNKDLGAIGVLLVVGACLFLTGLMLSHLPKQVKEEKER